MKNMHEKENREITEEHLNLNCSDEPLAVIQYNYFKLLIRWLFLYGPGTGVFLLPFMHPSSGWIWLMISSLMVFGMLLMFLVLPINMKSVSIYKTNIRQKYRIFGKDRIVDINKAHYSHVDRWLRECTIISDATKEYRKKGIVFNDGLITRASLKNFYLVLAEITGRRPEEFRSMGAKLIK
jgi:hypothetical protein